MDSLVRSGPEPGLSPQRGRVLPRQSLAIFFCVIAQVIAK